MFIHLPVFRKENARKKKECGHPYSPFKIVIKEF
jgi:hypothetical protein